MAKIHKGLGRGLDALLLGGKSEKDEMLRDLNVSLLQPGKYQPRSFLSEDALDELVDSIRAQGVMQPILVRQLEDDRYEIIAGERRWRAAKKAGLTHVPVLVRSVNDQVALAMALIENIQRENLNPLEEALGVQRLIKEFDMTHQQAAEAIGRSRTATSNLLRLLKLPESVQLLLQQGKLDMGHARALLPLDAARQILVANKIVMLQLSVRDTEKLVQQLLSEKMVATKPVVDADTLRLQEEISQFLGATVQIKSGNKGAGRLIIDYASHEQLDDLISRFRG